MISILRLVGVCKTTHTTHDAEHVVVGSVDIHLGTTAVGHGRWSQVEVECAIVDTRHVAGSAWLVLLWLEAE